MRLIVCCKDAFTSHVCILHVRFTFVCLLLVCLCLYVGFRVIVYAFAVVCRQVAFNITRACGLHVCVVFVCVVVFCVRLYVWV